MKRIPFVPLSKRNDNRWSAEGPALWLLTPKELESVPPGTVLTSISGRKVKVGTRDYIDGDTRFGFLAYGVLDAQLPEGAP